MEKGERGFWYSKHMETAIVIHSSYFVRMNLKGKHAHKLLQTLHGTSCSGGKACTKSSMLLWSQGQAYFWREGGRETVWQEGKTSRDISFLTTKSFLKASTPIFSQNA